MPQVLERSKMKRKYRTSVEYKDGRLYEFRSLEEAMGYTVMHELHVAGSGCTIREALELIRDYVPEIYDVRVETQRSERCYDSEAVYYNGTIDEEVLSLVC